MKTTDLETDLCIVGGGLSGVCAALAAARNGAAVVLIQNRSVLGGNSSSEIRMHIVGANFRRPGARESGLIEELRLDDAIRNPQSSPSLWDILLYDKLREEPRIVLLLDTECIGCTTETIGDEKRISRVLALRNSSEERFEIRARFFADCSGDGRLGMEAGADFRMGREAQSEFCESLAPLEADKETLGSTLLFMARKHDRPMPFIAPSWVRKFTSRDFAKRGLRNYEYGCWWAEWGGHLDTISDSDAIRHELMRIALGIWDYIKNSGEHPASAEWALDWVGTVPGKRESRRFLGPHILTENDLKTGAVFPDQVAFGGWPIDLHPTRGVDAVDEPACTQVHLPHLYSIPLNALFSRNIGNLFFAGRNISATHVAFASTRVMATCALMGQAIGTAVAVGVKSESGNARPYACDLTRNDTLREIQQTLLKDDAFLPGIRNEDPDDVARRAAIIQASSEAEDYPARLVTDGISRDLDAAWGPWSESKVHHWRSLELPAWIEMRWPTPTEIREIHLTFDTGFERSLTLSFSEVSRAGMIRGPQPETVKDYQIYGDGELLLSVVGNSQRKRRHRLPKMVEIQSLRIVVSATNGVQEARLFEIRAYQK